MRRVCPYCQQEFADGDPVGECKSCGRTSSSFVDKDSSSRVDSGKNGADDVPKTTGAISLTGRLKNSQDLSHKAEDGFSLPHLSPVPKIPEPSVVQYVKYTFDFGVAWWQRKKASKNLGQALHKDNSNLEEIYVDLGRAARYAEPKIAVFAEEFKLLEKLDERRFEAENAYTAMVVEKTEKTSKHELEDSEREKIINGYNTELEEVEDSKRSLERDKRDLLGRQKELEKEMKNIEGEIRQGESNVSAENDAALAGQVRVVLDKKRKSLSELSLKHDDFQTPIQQKEKEILETSNKIRYLRDQVDNQKRRYKSIKQAHKQEQINIENQVEELNKSWMAADRDMLSQFESLGRQCNLERVVHDELNDYYVSIDSLRSKVSKESGALVRIEKEMEAYDKSALIKGAALMGGGVVLVLIFLAILF